MSHPELALLTNQSHDRRRDSPAELDLQPGHLDQPVLCHHHLHVEQGKVLGHLVLATVKGRGAQGDAVGIKQPFVSPTLAK